MTQTKQWLTEPRTPPMRQNNRSRRANQGSSRIDRRSTQPLNDPTVRPTHPIKHALTDQRDHDEPTPSTLPTLPRDRCRAIAASARPTNTNARGAATPTTMSSTKWFPVAMTEYATTKG